MRSSLKIFSSDPDSGFTKVKEGKGFDDFKAKFCLFDILQTDDSIYFYFHSWYRRDTNALIVHYRSHGISKDMVSMLNILIWDYNQKSIEDQTQYTLSEVEESYTDNFVDGLKEALVGKNIMITYRQNHDKEVPHTAIHFERYKNPKSIIHLKPHIKVPRCLLPKYMKKEKKSITDIIKKKGSGAGDELQGAN